MKTAQDWIQALNLVPHPEGGYYVQTDISTQTDSNDGKDLPLYTNIFFLLTEHNASHFHQLTSDELWFFHAGSPLTVHSIHSNGSYTQNKLGLDLSQGERPQYTVPAGTIFGSTVEKGYALVSCTVVPGFDFSNFKLFTQVELLKHFPEHKDVITKLAYETLP